MVVGKLCVSINTLCNWDNKPYLCISHPRPERMNSLILNGPSRIGKTQLARSLGTHAYVSTTWDLTAFDSPYDYIVFDDVKFENIKHYAKAFFGCQRDFTVSDKYRKKKRLAAGVPFIYCCNPEDISDDFNAFINSDWGRQNIYMLTIPFNTRLY